MEQALYNMCSSSTLKTREAVLLVDGRDNYSFHIDAIPEPVYVVRGDSIIPQVMAASILAKVTRDRVMTEYGIIFPDYSFEKHK
ncbi:hypothetical protein H6768_05480 [Candidatus Peribacteria bacterium]|nr:hypothetical protein [Candidatus Peribacteria bacterium]